MNCSFKYIFKTFIPGLNLLIPRIELWYNSSFEYLYLTEIKVWNSEDLWFKIAKLCRRKFKLLANEYF